MAKRKVKLTFPEELITEPVIYKLGHEFKVVTNILQANVTKDSGWVVLEIDGENDEIGKAIDNLRDKGVKVEIHDSSEFVDL
jgi:ABC-type methionine transport system ATPase subunit